MELISRITEIDKRFCWSFAGWVVGVIGVALAIYFGLFFRMLPHITFELVSNTKIVDIHEDTAKLDVSYGGKSLKAAGDTLTVILLRVVNDGNAAVRMDAYTPDAPLGFTINEGEIIESPQIVEASSDYLRSTLKTSLVGGKKVTFSPAILNANTSATFKILVIHRAESGMAIDVSPIGVLADIDSIAVRHLSGPQAATPNQRQEGGGGSLTPGQAVVGLFGMLAAVVSSILLLSWVGFVLQRKRSSIVGAFIAERGLSMSDPVVNGLTVKYIGKGRSAITQVGNLLNGYKSGRFQPLTLLPLVEQGIAKALCDERTGAVTVVVPPEVSGLYLDFIRYLRGRKWS
jgi:hypothetical protein